MRMASFKNGAYVGECLLTAFMVTNMGLFASVGPRVYGQGTALNEALIAVLYGAMIRALIGVDAIMATEIRLAIERLPNNRLECEDGKRVSRAEVPTFPQCSHEQLKSRPLPGAMMQRSESSNNRRWEKESQRKGERGERT